MMHLNRVEKRTFILLLVSTFFGGLFTSLSQTQDIIAKKALHSLDWQLTILAMIWPVSNFFSIWWGKILENSKNKSKFFVLVAFIGRLTLIFGLWVNDMTEYLLLLSLVYFFSSLLIPATNSLYQNNIRKELRGKLFGYSVSLGTLLGMLITFISGRLLDINELWYKDILFATGVTGCISSLVLYYVKLNDNQDHHEARFSFKELLWTPIVRTFQLLKKNPDFSAFEKNFSIYGLGFLMVVPVIPIFLVEHLHMNYTSTFVAKGILSQLGILLFSPFFGKMHDHKDIFQFGSYVFGLLALYPLGFVIASLVPSIGVATVIILITYLIFGIAMAGVNVTWNMGSIYFAGNEDASMYQSVHITLTGVRGLIAPIFGFAIYKILGLTSVFVVAFLCEVYVSRLSYLKYKSKMKDLLG